MERRELVRRLFSEELSGMPPLDVAEEDFETYFYITEKGMDFHLADDTWWPPDDDAGASE